MKNKNILFIIILNILLLFNTVVYARTLSAEEVLASDLKSLGLFKGVSETNFDLERAPTRVEALVMLIRTLGKEELVLGSDWQHPFTDVPEWSNKYVGYAYENNLTKGVSATEFGNTNANSAMYLTFVLRALGYSDSNNQDFSWNDPYTLSKEIGILSDSVDIDNFLRADVVTISYDALSAKIKNSDMTLAKKLINANVFTEEQFTKIYLKEYSNNIQNNINELSAKQISEKCSSAVFTVKMYAFNGEFSGTGSGFFISSDGWAITNFHVVANSSMLEIKTTDGKIYSDVIVTAYDKENDIALIKINGNDFNYMELGDSNTISQGQNVYAIGSPLGLENTMSQGIISNVNRVIDNTTYIQISVPIAPGSSGGALINSYGKVIGITSAGFGGTGDLNLAVPINIAKKLSKEMNEGYILWMDNYYPGFESAYDFGSFSNLNLISHEVSIGCDEYYYDAFDFHTNSKYEDAELYARTMYYYQNALYNNGFVLVQGNEDGFSGLYSNYDTGENIIILIELENERIIVSPVHTIKTYKDYENIPDLGAYMNLAGNYIDNIDGSRTYSYRWADAYTYANMLYTLEEFMNACENVYGLDCVYAEDSSFLFVGNGYSVVIIIDGNYLYFDIK